jgi:hypothetical protein
MKRSKIEQLTISNKMLLVIIWVASIFLISLQFAGGRVFLGEGVV